MPPILSGFFLLIFATVSRDKVHPPCILFCIIRHLAFPLARVKYPRKWPPILFQSSRLHPRSLANDRAPAGAPPIDLISPPGRTGVPTRLRLIASQASHSTGQSVGVRGVFPCHTCATHRFPPPPPAAWYADQACGLDAFRVHGADALVTRPLHHGFEHVVCGGFGAVVGVSPAPLVSRFQSHAGELGYGLTARVDSNDNIEGGAVSIGTSSPTTLPSSCHRPPYHLPPTSPTTP